MDTVLSAVHDPHVLLFVESAYSIPTPVIELRVPADAPDQLSVGSLSTTVPDIVADVGAPHGDAAWKLTLSVIVEKVQILLVPLPVGCALPVKDIEMSCCADIFVIISAVKATDVVIVCVPVLEKRNPVATVTPANTQ
ncbi:hypothetical protein FACS1894184_12610 [Clostridia bacterium]|nr:hypothetical protein FACS1894184_12610 [Clostridia bacterium]